MFRNDSLLTVAVALLLLTSGCLGITISGAGSGSPTGDATTSAGPGTAGGGGSGTVGGAGDGSAGGAGETAPTAPADLGVNATADGFETARSYTALYDRTIDSVVEITVRTRRGRSQGSGFVYDQQGYIVTNQHVVGRAATVQVRFRDGAWRAGTVVGTDVYTDLAVVKVPSLPAGVDALPVSRRDPEPGQPVVALGSPLGYEGSITSGIVSGVNRSMQTSQGFAIPDTVQTDAPINPGNSGGPLVSLNGTVVGVNRAKQGDNLGFAISAAVVRQVVPDLVRNGSYHHAYLGIRTVPVTPRLAEVNGLANASGVIVVGVEEGGPAWGALETATLESTDVGPAYVGGDVILAVDGHRIRSQQELAQYLMLHTRPGDDLTVTVSRDGQRVTESVTLGRRPELG